MLNAMVFDMNVAAAGINARIHHQWLPDEILAEDGISPDTVRLLEQMGHQVKAGYSGGRTIGRTESIMIRDGWLLGATDTPGAPAAGWRATDHRQRRADTPGQARVRRVRLCAAGRRSLAVCRLMATTRPRCPRIRHLPRSPRVVAGVKRPCSGTGRGLRPHLHRQFHRGYPSSGPKMVNAGGAKASANINSEGSGAACPGGGSSPETRRCRWAPGG